MFAVFKKNIKKLDFWWTATVNLPRQIHRWCRENHGFQEFSEFFRCFFLGKHGQNREILESGVATEKKVEKTEKSMVFGFSETFFLRGSTF